VCCVWLRLLKDRISSLYSEAANILSSNLVLIGQVEAS
jgi:hypothetical protein